MRRLHGVKEPNTLKPTPWHSDNPYYFINGVQNVSMWMPLEPVKENTLRFIAGSHKWNKDVRPVSWNDNSDFYENKTDWIDVPDPDGVDQKNMKVLEWEMEPGDCVLFHFRTVHGARGNSSTERRRALSVRWIGDDARYIDRGARTSPPFEGHGMIEGDRLREDLFPVMYDERELRV